MRTLTYAGIGSRETPIDIQNQMTSIGKIMADRGHTLRSGGAQGADSAFHAGTLMSKNHENAEIYLPFKFFRGNPSSLFGTTKETRILASKFHPRWSNIGDSAREYLGRNMYIISGPEHTTPVDLVICWHPRNKKSGGTIHAMKYAEHLYIPIFNMIEDTLDDISDFVESAENKGYI